MAGFHKYQKAPAFQNIKSALRQYWICYLVGLAVVLVLKTTASEPELEDVEWILAPTARWAGILTGSAFPRQAHTGYINHSFRFIIAPSCSGTQFMAISTAALVFGFIHRMGTVKKGLCWIGASTAFSYLCTIFVNGVRIACAIFIPRRLPPGVFGTWTTPERFHTALGSVIYFASLLIMYDVAGYFLQKTGALPEDGTKTKILAPAFWYFLIMLGVPFLNRAYEKRGSEFVEYTIIITAVCLILMGLFYFASAIRRHFKP